MSDRVQIPTLLVIDALLGQDTEVHGWAVVKAVRLSPGTVYPILQRLEARGWVTSRWDDTHAGRSGPRRYYQFVDAYRVEADQLVDARLGAYRKATRDA
jgi:PadR family transcriptional regulator PadR